MAKREHEFKVCLKSGNILTVEADDLDITHRGGEMTSYEFKNAGPRRYPLFMDVDSIEAVEVVR